MAPSKLSDADKQDIIALYKNPGETTSTLAERYGVSNSTISRLLKSSLPESEYSALIQQKRSASEPTPPPTAPSAPKLRKTIAKEESSSTPQPSSVTADPKPQKTSQRRTRSKKSRTSVEEKAASPAAAASPPTDVKASSAKASSSAPPSPKEAAKPAKGAKSSPRRRSRQSSKETEEPAATPEQGILFEQAEVAETAAEPPQETKRPQLKLRNRGDRAETESPPDEVPLDDIDVLDDEDAVLPTQDDDYGDDDDDWDDGDDDEDTDEGDESAASTQFPNEAIVQIIPLTQDVLPKPCYLVVDRMAELVTQPLQSFGDLGPLPEAKTTAKTLPVFDNHRVARRFTQRNQRVVKVPDGGLLHKTSIYLQAKGITHLLIDGQVYSLT